MFEDQDNDNEFERMDGEDLQQLSMRQESKQEQLEDIITSIKVYEGVKALQQEKIDKMELEMDGIDSRLSKLKAQKMMLEAEMKIEQGVK